ncbi:Protein of unknown function [Pyronema omphalodes CBS 100304]|uniref:Uncharacterized protein n=1 Tax=Pyronema omphalodes (strain CBS 100304) TaxID=1076935 RepID=U4LJT6_PYROM|nr:Protein of unknown function [Pyronema omphalodes CBS 100304]
MGSMGLEDLKDGYIFREKPLKTIPDGTIQVSRAKAYKGGSPHEDEDSCFLYVVRDQFKDFKKFINLAESVFGLNAGHLRCLKGTKSSFLCYYDEDDKAKVINKWGKEASQKYRVYILSGKFPYNSDTVYYVEE